MTIENMLSRLEGVRRTSSGFMARCPAHDDKSPSLSVRVGDEAILMKFWAGCELQSVTDAMGLKVSDLFYDAPPAHGLRVVIRPAHVDRVRIAFNFEMAAVDYRVRSSSFFRQVEHLDVSGIAETELSIRGISTGGSTYPKFWHWGFKG